MQSYKFKIKLERNVSGIISNLEIDLETNSNNEEDMLSIINQAIRYYYPNWKLVDSPIIK